MGTVAEGITIGAAGGAIAGLMIWLLEFLHESIVERRDRTRVYRWLSANTRNEQGHRYRSTRAIASWTSLTEDRTRYVCSIDPRIHLGTADKDKETWTLLEREEPSIYEERGAIVI